MASGILGVGISGLLAYQRSLQTVSHNIANANTDGYSRQRVVLGTQTPNFMGGMYMGTGVKVQSVSRVYDSFMVGQVRSYTSSFNQAETFANHASMIDEMLADPQIGLMPAMESFFSATQGVANDPSSLPSRQAMITSAETLVDRFKYLDKRYEDLRTQVNQQLTDNVSEVNGLAQAIAQINRDIVLAPGNSPPNDLLDTRDKLLNQLAEKVSISTVEQDNGAMNVFFGKGQILVLNFDAQSLSVTRNSYDVSQFEVSIDNGVSGNLEISDQITGGKLGGLLDFRSKVLTPAQNSLGALAIGIADTFNAQHTLGQDLSGNLGTDFFKTAPLQILPGPGAPSAVVLNMDNSKQLTNDDYTLRYDGANNYTMIRSSDKQSFAFNTGGASPFTTATVDGFSMTITAGAAVGDSYLIRPGKIGASQLGMAITDTRSVAAATPVRAERALSNTGTATVSSGAVTNTGTLPLGPGGVTLTYNAGNILVAGALPASVPYVSGSKILLNDPGDGTGIEVVINGVPNNGDTFTINDNSGAVGDNRNGLLLAQLQTTRLLDNGKASYDEFYGGTVADVGIKTNQAQVIKSSQERLMEQAQNSRDALSGVNLDEEAANLVKFQQAYQAASQVIVTTNTMFQSLMAALRG